MSGKGLLIIVLCWLVMAQAALAHPMGNFSINHYAALRPDGAELRLIYHLDIAELPSVEEMRVLHADDDGQITSANKAAYLRQKGAELSAGLSLRINGQAATLNVASSDLQIRPGAAGLPILLVSIEFRVPLDRAGGRVRLSYDDQNFTSRTGWREVIATAGNGWDIVESDVPAKDLSDGLLNYPADLIAAPPQVTAAQLVLVPSARHVEASAPAGSGSAGATSASTPRDPFTQLILNRKMSAAFLIVALAIAFGLGAFHAMAPGHGKTVVAAYLVGSRGTAMHAVLLGAVVTATHVAGVFLLGVGVLLLSRFFVPEHFYPWLSFASGMTIFIVGCQQLVLRLRTTPSADEHDPARGGHAHVLPAQLSMVNLIAMGVSGGMVPCPSALVVLLGAIALGRTGLGIVLIVAFSIGLATVLVSLGLTAVYARQWLGRFHLPGGTLGLQRRLPLISSSAVALLGLAMATQALLAAMGIGKV